jgi:pseudouridine kinase
MHHKICVIGGMNFAVISKIDSDLQNDSSICGEVKTRFGGVARNIALNLAKYDELDIEFITVLSNDILGNIAKEELKSYHISFDNSLFMEKWESYYCETICKSGHYGVNDMKLIGLLNPEHLAKLKNHIEQASIIVVDANLNKETLEYIVHNINVPVICDTTSNQKCRRILKIIDKISTIKMNYSEACTLCNIETQAVPDIDTLKSALQKLPIKNMYVTLGVFGSFFISQTEYYHHNITNKIEAKNVLGAGDAFTSGIIKGILNNMSVEEILKYGSTKAEEVLKKNNT